MRSADHETQRVIRAWITQVLATKGWTSHRLAKEAKVGAATLSRALEDEPNFITSTKTIERIVRATGIAAPTGIGMGSNSFRGGLAEPEAIYIAAPSRDVAETLKVSGQQAVWQIKSRAIELAGYLIDDFLLVDPTVTPVTRDAVCVQIYDLKTGQAETVFRIYEPPFVTTETSDPASRRKPVTIDNERAGIWGVVVKSLRVRKP